jgi:hypothetical protein
MKLYRICTEAKNVSGVKRLVGAYFDGFDVKYGIGMWKGVSEDSLTIEIVTDDEAFTRSKIRQIARQIKLCNAQEAVLIQESNIESELI